jgi:flavoprotein
MFPIEKTVPARWTQAVFLCSKCMKKQDRKELRREVRDALKAAGRKDIRVVACGCLDVCPKHAVTVARSGELALDAPRLHLLDNGNDADVLKKWLIG